jgi:hypothetical protein
MRSPRIPSALQRRREDLFRRRRGSTTHLTRGRNGRCRVRGDLVLAEKLGELDGLHSPTHRLVEVEVEHRGATARRVRERKLAGRAERFEDVDRGSRLLERLVAVRPKVGHVRLMHEHLALLALVAELTVGDKSFCIGCGGLVDVLGERALVGELLDQLGPFAKRQLVGEAKRSGVLRRGFPVSAEARGSHRGGRRVLQHGRRVPRALRVVREPGGVAHPALGECREHATVEIRSPHRIERLLDRAPRKLVPELDRVLMRLQNAGSEAAL